MTAWTRRRWIAALAPSAWARQADFSTAVEVVNLFATVRDKRGALVKGLVREDFAVFENGRPREIRYFSGDRDLPFTAGLLIDTSGSQRRILEQERSASMRFLNRVLRERDAAFVVRFDGGVELLQGPTPSRDVLTGALRRIPQPNPNGRPNGTSMFDAIQSAAALIRAIAGRKTLIILSDGVDTSSRSTPAEAIESAQRADCSIQAIRFLDPDLHMFRRGYGGFPSLPDGGKVLKKLAAETGGAFHDVSEKQPLDQTFDAIEEEIRSQYSIGFPPDRSASPGYRRIRLEVKRKGLNVRTRDGYYGGGA